MTDFVATLLIAWLAWQLATPLRAPRLRCALTAALTAVGPGLCAGRLANDVGHAGLADALPRAVLVPYDVALASGAFCTVFLLGFAYQTLGVAYPGHGSHAPPAATQA